jgi:hypothetical protein
MKLTQLLVNDFMQERRLAAFLPGTALLQY